MTLEDLVSKQAKIMNYIKQDEETTRKLVEAKGDISKIRDVIKKASTDDFIVGIVDTPSYTPFVIDIADQIMSQFPEVVSEVQDKLLGIIKHKRPKPKKKYIKKYQSKTISGKTYNKGYQKWSTQETTFLKSRSGKSKKDITEEYNSFFSNSPRSESSIMTKFYRVQK